MLSEIQCSQLGSVRQERLHNTRDPTGTGIRVGHHSQLYASSFILTRVNPVDCKRGESGQGREEEAIAKSDQQMKIAGQVQQSLELSDRLQMRSYDSRRSEIQRSKLRQVWQDGDTCSGVAPATETERKGSEKAHRQQIGEQRLRRRALSHEAYLQRAQILESRQRTHRILIPWIFSAPPFSEPQSCCVRESLRRHLRHFGCVESDTWLNGDGQLTTNVPPAATDEAALVNAVFHDAF